MASIATGGGDHGGRRAVDHEIPLIPFIDLLLCCIMFLLVTAVWNQLARIDAHAPGAMTERPLVEEPLLIVQITDAGFHVATDAGDHTDIPRGEDGELDRDALREHLVARRRSAPRAPRVWLSPDDGIAYDQIVATMDTFAGSGYPNVTISGAH